MRITLEHFEDDRIENYGGITVENHKTVFDGALITSVNHRTQDNQTIEISFVACRMSFEPANSEIQKIENASKAIKTKKRTRKREVLL